MIFDKIKFVRHFVRNRVPEFDTHNCEHLADKNIQINNLTSEISSNADKLKQSFFGGFVMS